MDTYQSNQGPDRSETQLNLLRRQNVLADKNHAAKLVRRKKKDQDVILCFDWVLSLCSWLTLYLTLSLHNDVICGKVFLSDTTCLLLSGATVTRAAMKVWEWAPVTCRQGRYLFFLDEIQYLLLLLRGSQLCPELWGTKHLPSRDTAEVVSSVTVPWRAGEVV